MNFINFTANFWRFIGLHLLILIGSSFLAIYLQKFRLKNWGKFILSTFLLFTLQIFLSQILLGIFSILNYQNIWLLNSFISIPLIFFLWKKVRQKTEFPPPPKIKISFLLLLVPFFALFVLKYFYAFFHIPIEYDSVAYHLPFVTEWFKTQSLLPIYYNAFAGPISYYPSNFELFELWTFFPFGNDLFINFLNLPLFPLLVLAGYLILKNLKLSYSSILLGLGFLIYLPIFSHYLGSPHVDLFFTLCFLSAIYFLQEYYREKSNGNLIFAAIATGLFIGTKYLGIPYSLPLFIFSLAGIYKHYFPRNKIQGLYVFSSFLFLVIISGGFWYIRNFISAQNPLFPMEISLFGQKIFDGYFGMTERILKLSLAYNVQDLTTLKEFIFGFSEKVGLQTLLIPLIFLILVIYCGFLGYKILKRKLKETDNLKTALILLGAMTFYFFFYWQAPYTYDNLIPNVRYAMMFLVITSIATAFLTDKIKFLRHLFYLLLPIIIFYNLVFYIISWPGEKFIVNDKIPLVLNFLSKNFEFLLFFLIFLSVVVLFFFISIKKISKTKTYQASFLTVIIFIGCVSITDSLFYYSYSQNQRTFSSKFFYDKYHNIYSNISDVAHYWFDRNAPNAKIAYTGFNFHYHLFGRNLQREVDYININDCQNCRYVDFKNSRSSIRRDPDFNAWLKNLLAKNKEYLIITPYLTKGVEIYEFDWAKNHPEIFKPIFSEGGEVFVYKINKP